MDQVSIKTNILLLKDAIKEIGYKKVIQVITDNANVMKAAGAFIEGEYPKIFWTTCVAHTLNLALKNICVAKNTEINEVTNKEWVGLHVLLMMHSSYLFLSWTIQWGWQCLMSFVL